jgi:hypothetical protein
MESMMATWSVADAQEQLPLLIEKATSEGPQTVHGEQASAVLLSEDDYARLARRKPTFAEFLLSIPKGDFEFQRIDSRPRDLDL